MKHVGSGSDAGDTLGNDQHWHTAINRERIPRCPLLGSDPSRPSALFGAGGNGTQLVSRLGQSKVLRGDKPRQRRVTGEFLQEGLGAALRGRAGAHFDATFPKGDQNIPGILGATLLSGP